MAIYEMICTECKLECEVSCRIAEYDNMIKNTVCDECHSSLARHFRTPTNATIPAHMSHDGKVKVVGSKNAGKTDLPVPLNFIDEKPDGSYRVTRIGNTKADIDND